MSCVLEVYEGCMSGVLGVCQGCMRGVFSSLYTKTESCARADNELKIFLTALLSMVISQKNIQLRLRLYLPEQGLVDRIEVSNKTQAKVWSYMGYALVTSRHSVPVLATSSTT